MFQAPQRPQASTKSVSGNKRCATVFLQLYLLAQKKLMIYSGRYLCLTISTPHNIPIWICSHPISILSIYLTTWRQVCQSHFEFSPSLTKSFNLSGNHRLGQYIFASEYFDHTSYLSFFLHEQNFWRIKFTPKKRVNYDKIHSKLPIFLRYYGKIYSKLPIFCVKSVKICTGRKKITRVCLWRPWQISGMPRNPSFLDVCVHVNNFLV